MCLAQGHNTVTPARLKPAASQSRVKHSTTEPLRSLYRRLCKIQGISNNQLNVQKSKYFKRKFAIMILSISFIMCVLGSQKNRLID